MTYNIISIANYDGTDIGRPYLVDNSTDTPVYIYLDDDDYHPPSNHYKRGATSLSYRLWPKGIVYYNFDSSLTGQQYSYIYTVNNTLVIYDILI